MRFHLGFLPGSHEPGPHNEEVAADDDGDADPVCGVVRDVVGDEGLELQFVVVEVLQCGRGRIVGGGGVHGGVLWLDCVWRESLCWREIER